MRNVLTSPKSKLYKNELQGNSKVRELHEILQHKAIFLIGTHILKQAFFLYFIPYIKQCACYNVSFTDFTFGLFHYHKMGRWYLTAQK